MLLICITVFLSYLPEAGQYSSFFLYLRQVSPALPWSAFLPSGDRNTHVEGAGVAEAFRNEGRSAHGCSPASAAHPGGSDGSHVPVGKSELVCCSCPWGGSDPAEEGSAAAWEDSRHRKGGVCVCRFLLRAQVHGQGLTLKNCLVINEELGGFYGICCAFLFIDVSFSGNLLDNEIFARECGCIYSSSRHSVHHCTGESLPWVGGTCLQGWPRLAGGMGPQRPSRAGSGGVTALRVCGYRFRN